MQRISAALILVVLSLAALSEQAVAVSIVDLVGDKDGFGLAGAPAVPANGTRWVTDLGGVFFTDYRDAGDLANAPFTDIWDSPGSISYSHTYALGALVPVSAVLDIQIAGIHDVNQLNVYDVVVDATTIGQIPPNLGADNFQEVILYSFNVPVGLINGTDAVSVSLTGGDGFSINFSELRIEAIPEPATAILAGVGLLGVMVLRRRASKHRLMTA